MELQHTKKVVETVHIKASELVEALRHQINPERGGDYFERRETGWVVMHSAHHGSDYRARDATPEEVALLEACLLLKSYFRGRGD